MARFEGKTAVITGAGSGIGRATARLFASEGAHVVASDLDPVGLAGVADEIKAAGAGEVTTVECDVTDVGQIEALMNTAASAGPAAGIDVVFNNAGAVGDRAPIDEIDAAGWDGTMDLLLRSVAMGIRYAAPHMKQRPGAAIINTSSIAGIGPGYSPIAYAVAKAGVLQLTRCAAADLAQYGIRVCAVQPGFINTNIFASGVGVPADQLDEVNALIRDVSAQAQPVARPGVADDIAAAVAYLASDAASFVTGTSLIVDGGITVGPRNSWDPEVPSLFAAVRDFAPTASPDA